MQAKRRLIAAAGFALVAAAIWFFIRSASMRPGSKAWAHASAENDWRAFAPVTVDVKGLGDDMWIVEQGPADPEFLRKGAQVMRQLNLPFEWKADVSAPAQAARQPREALRVDVRVRAAQPGSSIHVRGHAHHVRISPQSPVGSCARISVPARALQGTGL